MIAPVILTSADTQASAMLGRDRVVFDLDDPSSWEAELSPAGLARFIPGGLQDGFETSSSLELIAPGVLTVVLTGADGQVRTHLLTILENPDSTAGDLNDKSATKEFADSLLGKTEELAIKAVLDAGLLYRIVARDGDEYALTADYRPNRVNMRIVDDLVVDAVVG